MNDITLMTIIAFILFMSTGVTGPLSSLYAESLGADYVAIGLLGTVRSLAAIVFGYVWGRASDLWGQRKVFLVGSLAALSLSYGLISLAPSYRWLYPLRVLGALAQAGYGTASLALMGDLLERRSKDRGRRMGTFRGLASLGFGLMALISGTHRGPIFSARALCDGRGLCRRGFCGGALCARTGTGRSSACAQADAARGAAHCAHLGRPDVAREPRPP